VLVELMSMHSQNEHTSCAMRTQDALRPVQDAAQGAISQLAGLVSQRQSCTFPSNAG